VENVGEATAEDVSAMIAVEGPAMVMGSDEKALDDLGPTQTVSWTVKCTGSGPVTITVTPAGTDANTGEAIPASNIASASVTVNQEMKAHLVATVEAPDMVEVGDEFTVTAIISNTGEASAEDVSAMLTVEGDAELAVGEAPEKPADPDTVAGGSSVEITWTLVCTEGGSVTLTVMPDGIDGNVGLPIPSDNLESGSATVNQRYRMFMPFTARTYGP
jgi:hypothetical protein